MDHWTGQANSIFIHEFQWCACILPVLVNRQLALLACRERLAAKNGNGLSHRVGFAPAIVLRLLGTLFQLYVLQICGFQLLLVP